jgi:hypothetical protein
MLVETILATVVFGVLLYPVVYAGYYKLEHKVLFVAACYGIEQIITVLLFGLLSPLFFLKTFAFPQLAANESIEGLRWLLVAMSFVEDYWYFGAIFLLLIAPYMIRRSYRDIFVVRREK